jgi:hypothetical protein
MTYRCKNCDMSFDTEREAYEHLVDTGSYSPEEHVTHFHLIEGINDGK